MPGLYVVGEAAFTGVHGANRLASNSLLEAVYLAEAAAAAVRGEPAVVSQAAVPPVPADVLRRTGQEPDPMILEHDWDEVRRVMWDYVGIVRDRERLGVALGRLREIRRTVENLYLASAITPHLVELRNIALLGELIVICARARRESRGLHYVTDHPDKDPGPARDTCLAVDRPAAGETASPDGGAGGAA